jgi:murein DD-endopeptidase MepM/ murein hydrolase activator NlpD
MNQFLQKFLSPAMRVKAVVACSIILVCAVLVGVQINRWIIKSRTVTQAQIAEGWKAAGLELAEHTIQQKENFWNVSRKYKVDVDTILGANPGLTKLHAELGQTIRVPNRKGVVHRSEEQESVQTIVALYKVPIETITSINNLGPKSILMPGLDLFIPGVKPVILTAEITEQCSLRGMFCSPLLGTVTSGMGWRRHPTGGFRGKHTGIDIAAREGTSITAAAAGTVVQIGEGEYIGKFVILSHKDSYTTLYGHCSRILATPGKTVKKGQVIAKSGHTGRVTGPHVHFEIRKNGVPQDPLKYLW